MKASAGTLYAVVVQSVVAAVRYLKIYNLSTAPTSADAPLLRILIPGSTAGAAVTIPFSVCGVAFSSGISFRLTTGQADNNAAAVTAGDGVILLTYA